MISRRHLSLARFTCSSRQSSYVINPLTNKMYKLRLILYKTHSDKTECKAFNLCFTYLQVHLVSFDGRETVKVN